MKLFTSELKNVYMEKVNTVPMLLPYEPNEFWQQLRQVIQEELTRNQQASAPKGEEPLLGRREMAGRLKISLVTLHSWMNRGLPRHKQGGKVYFLDSEVMAYIKREHLEKKETILSRFGVAGA